MKAFAVHGYGTPEQLKLTDIDRPTPDPDEVLVRIHATSVNPYDWHNLRGEPYIARLMPGTIGLRGPNLNIVGCDIAGQVEAVGANVTEYSQGDDVFALLPNGGFAEYVNVPRNLLVPKPKNLSHAQAAAVPMAGMTALLSLAKLRPGQAVLVNGASGGVGTFAVQIAHARGAKVTGVCGIHNADLVRSLGADEVIDYHTVDFTSTGQRYDMLVNIAGSRPMSACRRVLTRKGSYVFVGGQPGRWVQPAGHAMAAMASGLWMSQNITIANLPGYADKKGLLLELSDLIEDNAVTPVIHRTYPFAEIPKAVAYQEQGHAPGKVVVTLT